MSTAAENIYWQWTQAFEAVFFTLDRKGRWVFVGEEARELLKLEPEQMQGSYLQQVVESEDHEGLKVFLDRIMDGQFLHPFTCRLMSPKGGTISVWIDARWNNGEDLIYGMIRKGSQQVKTAQGYNNWEHLVSMQPSGLQDFLDRMEEGFTILDKDWRIVFSNRGAENISGRKREEVLFKNHWACYPQLVGTVVEEKYRKAFQEQTPQKFEVFVPAPYHLWLQVNAYPSAQGLTIFFQDITIQKKAEEEHTTFEARIREQNETLTDILFRISDCFFAVDQNFMVTYWNHKAEEVMGITSEDITGKTLWDCFPGSRTSIWYETLNKTWSEQCTTCFEVRSTLRPVLLEVTVYPSPKGLSVFFKDITEKRKSEEELLRLSLMVQETADAVSIVDTFGKVSWINQAFTRLTGYSLEEMAVEGYHLLSGPLTDKAELNRMAQNLEKGRPFYGELLIYTKNKKKRWMDLSCQPVRDENGFIRQYFFIQTDITERKRLEKNLQEQKNKMTVAVLEGQEKERSQIARELHDNVNQVLTTVKLYTELCLSGTAKAEELMKRSAHLLQASISEIRNLSRRLSAPSLAKSTLGESIGELVRMISDTNQLQLHLEITGVDNLQIEQNLHLAIYRVLQEQLTNILKHARATEVRVVLRHEHKVLHLEVQDNGKGFDTREKAKGIGISNMVSRVEAFQGVLHLKSAPGKGCVLSAIFPLKLMSK